MKAILKKALLANHLVLDQALQDGLLQFLDMLMRWNQVFNLTAIRDPEQAVWLHLIDSLMILPFVHGKRIIDVGSGGGLPGIPLALSRPESEFVLLDSNGKKTRFLQQAVRELGLTNVTVVHSRAEIFHPPTGFDSIITRAFATLTTMLELTDHLLNPDGQFLAMKGAYPTDEIKKLPAGYSLVSVQRLNIAGLDAERHLVCIQKA